MTAQFLQQHRCRSIALSLANLCLIGGVWKLGMTSVQAAVQPLSPVTVRPSSPSPLPSPHLLEQGRTFYQTGRFAEAVMAWKTAAQAYQIQGDRLNEALSFSYLSLAQQELNQWDAARQSIEHCLDLLKTSQPPADAILWAQAFNTQANLQLHLGQTQTALENWQQAQKFYEQVGDTIGSIGSQINQAQALQSLGFYRRSKQQLEGIAQQLQRMPDSEIKVSGLRSLGLALEAIGDTSKSQEVLTQSLTIAQQISASSHISSILIGLGKIAVDLNDPNQAFELFQQADRAANQPNHHLQAQLAQLRLFIDYNKPELATPLVPPILQHLKELPASRDSLYAAINFVATLHYLDRWAQVVPVKTLAELMATTVRSAQQIQDDRAQAYALHQWAELYQSTQQWSEAKTLAQKALNIARQIQADDIIAQAAWQLGQLYKQQGNVREAISSYTEAIDALKALRADLVAINSNVQFSFRENVEPVYRELVALLLDNQPSQADLLKVRELIEALQITELDNFFREACLDKPTQIDRVDPKAAVIYPIILPDRLATIVSLAGQPLRYYVTYQPQAEIERTFRHILESLNPVSDGEKRHQLSQKIYDWLIRPAEAEQVFKDTKTLVFVLDGRLRNIPMSALSDGKHYLIEKYAVALSPGLQLMNSRSLSSSRLSAIVGGISESLQGFSALPAVESEVKQVAHVVSSSLLLNREFTSQALAHRLQISRAPIVHLATHGQFSSRLEDTFLLAWDRRINVKELSELLKNREGDPAKAIELLVLSACDTASGDDRAVLGLAGLAVKSGARSTLATLWPVKDKAAALLMTYFYEQLRQPGITKAEALRQAQIALIRQTDFRDPFFWSGFVLVGNWL